MRVPGLSESPTGSNLYRALERSIRIVNLPHIDAVLTQFSQQPDRPVRRSQRHLESTKTRNRNSVAHLEIADPRIREIERLSPSRKSPENMSQTESPALSGAWISIPPAVSQQTGTFRIGGFSSISPSVYRVLSAS